MAMAETSKSQIAGSIWSTLLETARHLLASANSWSVWRDSDKVAREELITRYLPLVRSLARRFVSAGNRSKT